MRISDCSSDVCSSDLSWATRRHDMTDRMNRAGLKVAPALVQFIETEALPGTGIDTDAFWRGVSALYSRFSPANSAMLDTLDRIQAPIDGWYAAHPRTPNDQPPSQHSPPVNPYHVEPK